MTPGVLGPDYFREAAAILDAAGGGPPDFGEIATVMRRHGLTPCALKMTVPITDGEAILRRENHEISILVATDGGVPARDAIVR